MLLVTVINRPLWLLVFLVTNVKRPLRIMTSFVTIVFKDRYEMTPSNRLVKSPLPLWLISNGRCGGVVGLGLAGLIGNARCFTAITYVLICNGLQAPVTNTVLPIWDFHVVEHPRHEILSGRRDKSHGYLASSTSLAPWQLEAVCSRIGWDVPQW